ncbi:MAG: adenine-specific methyltransferase [Rhodocyclaceae bacterium]|nr:adenine-specific methyltransferase [Rhodocyclaceae bacterium]
MALISATADQKANTLQPFLKWAGGKRWFVQKHADIFPKNFRRYVEPFLGGGSVFFHLQPRKSLLGDVNPDVISVYRGVKEDWKAVVDKLRQHQKLHSDEHYYMVRAQQPTDAVSQASRMLYLNRTCFNGIYRVNLQGEFNVPRGTKNWVLRDDDQFEEISKLLTRAEIRLTDFESLIDEAGKEDFIFCDPPYTVRHNFNGFVKYNEKLFSWSDQERLAAALLRAKARGATVLATNANHHSVRDLYESHGFRLLTTSRYSSISASAEYRKQFDELIILS